MPTRSTLRIRINWTLMLSLPSRWLASSTSVWAAAVRSACSETERARACSVVSTPTKSSVPRERLLECLFAALTVPNSYRLIDLKQEHLPVTYLAAASCRDNRLDGTFGQLVGQHGLQLDLGQQIHRVFGSPVDFRVALLAPVPPDLADRHSLDTNPVPGSTNGVQSVG